VLVEVNLAVVLRHVDFKLLRRPPPLPAIVGIAGFKVAFGQAERKAAR